jgi:hypothetical protein
MNYRHIWLQWTSPEEWSNSYFQVLFQRFLIYIYGCMNNQSNYVKCRHLHKEYVNKSERVDGIERDGYVSVLSYRTNPSRWHKLVYWEQRVHFSLQKCYQCTWSTRQQLVKAHLSHWEKKTTTIIQYLIFYCLIICD